MENNSSLKTAFIKCGNDDNHRPLLWLALEATHGAIVEMGMGYGSTPYLFEYAVRNNRPMHSYETNPDWFDKFNHYFDVNFTKYLIRVLEWDDVIIRNYIPTSTMIANELSYYPSTVLLDHAPGERRGDDLALFANPAFNGIIVAHDTEPAADHGYGMRKHFDKFKYVCEIKTDGAWATALSNIIDVTQWVGMQLGDHVISAYEKQPIKTI